MAPTSRNLVAIALGACFLVGPARGAEESPLRKLDDAEKTASGPPARKSPEEDLFLLSSGEWMTGSFAGFADHEIQLESVSMNGIALGDLDLAFADIVEIRFHAVNTFLLPNQKKVVGVGKISGQQVTVETEAGTERFPRSDLVSIAKGSIREFDLWSGGASVGLTKNSGNSNELQLLVLAHLVRQGETLRFRTHYRNNLSETDGVDTVKNQRLDSRLDLFVGDRLYLTPAILDYYSDEFQNIDWRLSPGAGAGYEIIRRKKAEWDAALALVYQQTRYVSVLGSGSPQDDAVAIKLQTHFKLDFNSYLSLRGDYSVTVDLEDSADITQHSLIKLDVAMTRHLNLNLAFIWDRVGDPQANAQGIVPKKDDFKISFGAGVHF